MKQRFYKTLARLILALPAFIILTGCQAQNLSDETRIQPKAAIVDQLNLRAPNQSFIDEATGMLASHGFKVDIYRGDEVTVDFYRDLPNRRYRLIIFRSHSGLQSGTAHLSSGDKAVVRTYLFTNEAYSTTAHIVDQLSDRLAKVRVGDDDQWEFGISPDFVSRSMPGKFDPAVVITMGCYTSYVNDLAQSFIEKGASAYIGWDNFVGVDYIDNATTALLANLLSNKVSLDGAVTDTLQKMGADPTWGAKLKYFPAQNGNQTISELTGINWPSFKDQELAPAKTEAK